MIGVYNGNGVQVASYDYDAWGNVINKSGTMADVNPIRYRGYYYDTETGFYYLNTRYYDPEIRRFVNADNYELLPELAGVYGQVNLYNYCNNNPVMYTDPTGELGILLSILIGTSIGLATEFIGDWAEDGIIFNRSWRDYLGAGLAGAFGGMGTGLLSTMVFSGVGDVVGGLVAGEITSAQQAIGTFALSAIVSGAGYGIAKGVQHGLASVKYSNIIGNASENITINKRLAEAGIKGVKIGRQGRSGIINAIKNRTYSYIDDSINAIYSFTYGSLRSIYGF